MCLQVLAALYLVTTSVDDEVVVGEVEEVLLDEVEGFAIKLSTGNETGGAGAGGGECDTSLEFEEAELSGGTLMCLKTFCHMVA